MLDSESSMPRPRQSNKVNRHPEIQLYSLSSFVNWWHGKGFGRNEFLVADWVSRLNDHWLDLWPFAFSLVACTVYRCS